MREDPHSTTMRRGMSFADAVFNGHSTLEVRGWCRSTTCTRFAPGACPTRGDPSPSLLPFPPLVETLEPRALW